MAKNDECRKTWLRDAQDKIDYKFVIGGGYTKQYEDELVVPVGDSYIDLPAKIQSSHKWALEQGYDQILKTDCDMYLCTPRLLGSGFADYSYSGNFYWSGFALGACYWLDLRASLALVSAPLPPYPADGGDDVWVGHVMAENNIQGHHDPRYYIGPEKDILWDSVISLHMTDFPQFTMAEIHKKFQ